MNDHLRHEIRRNEDDSLDEVVAFGFVHLEQMDGGHWWLGIDTADGKMIHVNLWTKRNAKIHGRAEYEGASSRVEEALRKACDESRCPTCPRRWS